jgi:methyl-accepting chemotaxis protein
MVDNIAPIDGRRSVPLGHRVVFGLTGMLVLFLASMVVAIGLVVAIRDASNRLGDTDVPYAQAIASASLEAKSVANDQRGFLLTGDPGFMTEAASRADRARASFDSAQAAASVGQYHAVASARAGFERWVTQVNAEFARFQSGDRRGAIAASLGPDRELRKSYEQALAVAQQMADDSVASARSAVAADASRSILVLIACLVVTLAIGVAVAVWLVRTIALPVFRLLNILTPDLPS